MKNTVTITVHRSVFHPLYQKRYRMSKKFLADTNDMVVHVGDLVEISECRPLSKRKHFRVSSIVKKAAQVSELAEEAGLAGVMRSKSTPEESPTSPKNNSSSDSSESSDSAVSSSTA
ncbi:MAG: small subunit ribosomal protein S17 [Candidatus Peregrinibacteria bacterium Greene0416_19]|nr:MAG: small subunit ribosomal protein S17 [Candidatus Peregrinibacteria bacterium Greene0416_19]